MYIEKVTKKEIREMPWKDALDLLIEGTKDHLTGAGCGPSHQIPVGEKRHRFVIAMAKAYYKRWGYYPDYVK